MSDIEKKRRVFVFLLMIAGLISGAAAVFIGHSAFSLALAQGGIERAQWMAQEFTNEQVLDLVSGSEIGLDHHIALYDKVEDGSSFYENRWFYNAAGVSISHFSAEDNAVFHQVFNKRNAFVAREVIRTGVPIFETAKMDGDILSRTFVPLTNKSGTFGVLEVLVNETANWQGLLDQFFMAAFKVVSLMALVFAFPAYLYLRDVSKWKLKASTLEDTQKYDLLTRVLTRPAFIDFLKKTQLKLDQEKAGAKLIIIDLDRFKSVNESRGQVFGDELLSQVAKRVRFLLGPHEKLSRLGGDEFAVYQPEISSKNGKKNVSVGEIFDELSKPFEILETEMKMEFSIGHALYPRDGKSLTEVLRAADIAVGHGKKQIGSSIAEFKLGMQSVREERRKIEDRLRQALADNEFTLQYQPQYNVGGTKISGFEALLRLKDNDGRPISPDVFIPIAEDVGLISAIGEWVLNEAVNQAANWPENISVAVNLSPIQFKTQNLPQLVEAASANSGVATSRIELEVTEGLLIDDTSRVLTIFKDLKKIGVSLALDDFGTGYSSLNYLWQFPFDKLKIDKSFINDLSEDDVKARDILSAVVAMGRALGLRIIAEGVETEEQASVLKALNCDLIQGYLYSKPINPIDVIALIELHAESEVSERNADKDTNEVVSLNQFRA